MPVIAGHNPTWHCNAKTGSTRDCEWTRFASAGSGVGGGAPLRGCHDLLGDHDQQGDGADH
jgi:hypothetical protein